MTMELDEMKLAWNELNRRIEESDALNTNLRREIKVDKAQSALHRWLWLPAGELVLALIGCIWSGGFLADNYHLALQGPWGAMPALVFFLLSIFSVVAAVRQLVAIGSIDYAAPVLVIQRQLLQARRLRIRLTQWGLLAWLPLWPLFMIFLVQVLLEFDMYRQFGVAWIASNVVFGLVIGAGAAWAAYRYAGRLKRWPAFAWLSDEIAGRSLVKAMRQLDEVARFERV
jgi:hypothetical protein